MTILERSATVLHTPKFANPSRARLRATRHTPRRIRVAMGLVDCLVMVVLLLIFNPERPFDGRLPIDIPFLGSLVLANSALMGLTAVAMWMAALTFTGSYHPGVLGSGSVEYKRVLVATLSVAGTVAMSCYLFKVPLSRAYFLSVFGVGIPLVLICRFIMRKAIQYARCHGFLRVPVLVAGSPARVNEVIAALRREPWLGYSVAGVLVPKQLGFLNRIGGSAVIGTIDRVAAIATEVQASVVIFAEGSFASQANFRRTAWEFEELSAQMIVVPEVADVSANRLTMRPVAGLPLVHVEPPQAVAAGRWPKRIFDILLGSLFSLLSLPIVIAVAIAIKLDDGGPVFFRQIRVGRGGRTFYCYKIRSMRLDAETILSSLLQNNEGAGVLFKMANDPRVTRVGRFIRRFSIDEVPQFWNVVLGEMSLVGPRPALVREVQAYDNEDTMRRLAVRPGLTGLWQVSGRSDLSWDETVRLDLYYCDNWSVVQDIMILVRTAKAVLASRGAY